jgi:phosphohistidine phosphatase SixA
LFTVRGSKTRDNVAASLDARQNKVTRVLSSNAWQMLEAA